MPINHRQITCTDTPQEACFIDNQTHEVHLHNHSKASNNYIYIGSENVSATNSIHLDPGESLRLQLPAGEQIYAMSDPSGVVLGVMQINAKD